MRPSTLIGSKLPGLPWRITGYKISKDKLVLTLRPTEPRQQEDAE